MACVFHAAVRPSWSLVVDEPFTRPRMALDFFAVTVSKHGCGTPVVSRSSDYKSDALTWTIEN